MTEGILCCKTDGYYILSPIDRSVVTRLYEHNLEKDDEEINAERPVWYDLETGQWQLTAPV